MSQVLIETDRLLLRTWKEADLAPFAALNADPEVMRYFPKPLSLEEAASLIARTGADAQDQGFSYLPVEVKESGLFIGFVGLTQVTAPNPLAGDIEIGWRLAKEAWGHGYASEAALGWLDYAFEDLNAPRVVAFTATQNLPSQKVMQRIGMNARPDLDFDHPSLPDGHALSRHVVYVRESS